MSLESLPPQLLNVDHEHCFESGLGLAPAHFKKLGSLTLLDIVDVLNVPSETVIPIERGLAWLKNFDLRATYIEKLKPEDAAFSNTLIASGVTACSVIPTINMTLDYLQQGAALLTQINYIADTGDPDWNLDHVVYLGEAGPEDILIIDPNGTSFAVEAPGISTFWGRYPNLMAIEAA